MSHDAVLQQFFKGIQPLRGRIPKIYLFGSRARGTARADSDYDLLLVVTSDFSRADKNDVYDIVFDVLLETGKLVSLKIFQETRFKYLLKLKTPFTQNVLREGVLV